MKGMTEHKEENIYATYRNKTQEYAQLLEISHQITSHFMIKSVAIIPCHIGHIHFKKESQSWKKPLW